ncbi:MAG TPA: 2Fe-2S iron-sulfur cluster-binding protein [Sedimentibacter sp.]|nr:(2Fe-2S)-binding protein [Sedimentibacter sp.]HHY99956.1 4Fe-4S binding protein [Tissierellia bacterium]HOK48999.1 2Fe-2S iron-sulfur cluster-binding protein [Sedimentibacter sp.]HOW22458.1 2Fe-2S iron-sulfur cluster-binding protein [Sedimentibacter sp.]HRC81374.1 2Fe-2S iron-sulfur cluster-binding protein [Sedimentibacter sp.]
MKVIINNIEYEGLPGETLMELAKRNKVNIPNLCHKEGFEGQGRCRLCMVEAREGNKTKIVSACVYPIHDGLEVNTDSEKIRAMRKNIILLLLLKTPNNEYIKKLAEEYDVKAPERYMDFSINENCILCGLCVKACEKMGTSAISLVNRGTGKKVSTPFDDPSKDCIGCGACAQVCPTNAITMTEANGVRTIWNKEFKMVQCSICNKHYTTEEALDFIESRLGNEEEKVCDTCRKKIISEKFKESYKNIFGQP